jgi:muconolactone D-isomerase
LEFLVHIEIRQQAHGEHDDIARLGDAERARAAELAREGRIRRLWRLPGRRGNWGLWEAPDATVLHEALASLPLYPWLDVEVIALARHPSDPDHPARSRHDTSPLDR